MSARVNTKKRDICTVHMHISLLKSSGVTHADARVFVHRFDHVLPVNIVFPASAIPMSGSSESSSAPTLRSHNFKVVLLGEGCVGKTSIVLRYVEQKFTDAHVSTLQVGLLDLLSEANTADSQASFVSKKLNISGRRVNLAIWDTAGQERFHALGPIYYRDSHGAVLVYDITDEDSFAKVKNWVRELRKMLGEAVCICIVGNKLDLERDRAVPVEEAREYAEAVGAKNCETSAKMNKGIDELFLDLSMAMIEEADRSAPPTLASPSTSNSVQIADDSFDESAQPRQQSKTCC